LFKRAQKVIPGGVNSPVRAFNAVGGTPVYITSANGAEMTTADGHTLIDFCGSWGPLILGHAREEIVSAVNRAASKGTSFGTNTPAEVEFAELICELVPYIDKVRLVSSGTEAVMTAIRLARGFTGRQKIIKFDGCYHGHSDGLLVSAGSGLLTGGLTSSAGVSPAIGEEVFIPPFNDSSAVEAIVAEHGDEIAAIIVEPVAGNMGLVSPTGGFLESLRESADKCGAVLIFDEVITGFRLAATTFGALCGVTPDLTCMGKIIGGGMPIGAVGGRNDIMACLAPCGDVYQAGTLSGNPVAVAVGLTTLQLLRDENPYSRLEELGNRVASVMTAAASGAGTSMHCKSLGGMFTPFFTSGTVENLTDARKCDTSNHASFFHGMLDRGIYLPPSQFEVAFISAAHRDNHIDALLQAASEVFAETTWNLG